MIDGDIEISGNSEKWLRDWSKHGINGDGKENDRDGG